MNIGDRYANYGEWLRADLNMCTPAHVKGIVSEGPQGRSNGSGLFGPTSMQKARNVNLQTCADGGNDNVM